VRQAPSPRLRQRLECIRPGGPGGQASRIAAQLGLDQATVRRAIHRLALGGLDGLAGRPRGGRPLRDRTAVPEPGLHGAVLVRVVALEDLQAMPGDVHDVHWRLAGPGSEQGLAGEGVHGPPGRAPGHIQL